MRSVLSAKNFFHSADTFNNFNDSLKDDFSEFFLNSICSNPVQTSSDYPVRCGSRLKSKCPSCAEITRGDWAAIARSGIFGAPAGRNFRFYFLTLTAPSFGKVHRIPKDVKKYAWKKCACGKKHSDKDDHLTGVPVDFNSYDYDGAIRFNFMFGALWNNTKTRLRDLWPSLEFFAVREWQSRGVLHLHVLIRIDTFEAPLPSALSSRAQSATVFDAATASDIFWGDQVRCDPLYSDGDGAKTVWYVSKLINYTHKDLGLKYGVTLSAERRNHLIRLSETAMKMDCEGEFKTADGETVNCAGPNCHGKRHRNLGSSTHVISYSRKTKKRDGWSFEGLTRKKQREVRQSWARQNAAANGEPEDFRAAHWARLHRGQKIQAEWQSATAGRSP